MFKRPCRHLAFWLECSFPSQSGTIFVVVVVLKQIRGRFPVGSSDVPCVPSGEVTFLLLFFFKFFFPLAQL